MPRWLAAAALCIVFAVSTLQAADPPAAKTAPESGSPLHPRVKMETSQGDIVLELDGEKAPVSTANFLRYVEDGFYNGTVFHRIMKDFMIQGGGFTALSEQKMSGLHDPIKNEWKNGLKNGRGTIAMARTSEPDSATAQFFINVVDNQMLDQPNGGAAYAVFGKVVEGMDVVDKIRNMAVTPDPRGEMSKPTEVVTVKTAKVVGTYDKQKIGSMAETAGKLPPIPAWKKKIDEVRRAYGACQTAKAAVDSAPADKKEAAQKEADRLMAVAKGLEADVKKIAADEAEQEIQAYVTKQEKEAGKKFEKTASGLRYIIVTPGKGGSPKSTDTVEVHCTGWLLDGTKFYSTHDQGQPLTMPITRFVAGWIEAVPTMKVGETRKLVIPPALAYAFSPPTPTIPQNAPLVFDIELLGIK